MRLTQWWTLPIVYSFNFIDALVTVSVSFFRVINLVVALKFFLLTKSNKLLIGIVNEVLLGIFIL